MLELWVIALLLLSVMFIKSNSKISGILFSIIFLLILLFRVIQGHSEDLELILMVFSLFSGCALLIPSRPDKKNIIQPTFSP